MPHLKSAFSRGVSLCIVAAFVAGCGGPRGQVAIGDPNQRAIGNRTDIANAQTISAGDRLRVSVFGDISVNGQFLNGEYAVDDRGVIALPLLGPIQVAGMTPTGAADAIGAGLVNAGLFRDPRVTVEVLTLKPVSVLGEVNRPGEYPYRAGLSLYAAVAAAGGYTYRADRNVVYIRKANETIEQQYKLNADIAVMPGDVIRIPERYF